MLSMSEEAGVPVDITVVIALLRQLLPAVALFSRHNRENAIGTLSPHRLIVTAQNRLVIAEHAFGPALEKLGFGRDRLWRDFRITMPATANLSRANQSADAMSVGVVALSLLLGRVLRPHEYPAELEALVQAVTEQRAGDAAPLSASFATWLSRALQLDARTAFQTPSEAQLAFESVLASDRSYVTSSKALEEWVKVIGTALEERHAPPPPPPVPELEAQSDAPSHAEVESPPPAALSFLREDYSELRQMSVEVIESDTEPSDTSWVPKRERAPYLEEIAEPAPSLSDIASQPEAVTASTDEPKTEAAPEPEAATVTRVRDSRSSDEQVSQALQALDEPDALPPPGVQAVETAEVPDAREIPAPQEPKAPKGRKARKAAKAAKAAESRKAHEAPSAHEAPDALAALDALDAPEAPDAPQAPYAPEAPDAPEAPYAQYAPYAPGAAPDAEPEAPYDSYVPLGSYAPDGSAADARTKLLVRVLAGLVVLLIGIVSWQFTRPMPELGVGEGELVITSNPEGARVTIEGTQRGVTPLTVRLHAGAYVVEVQAGASEPRVIPVQVKAGMSTAQYVELQGVSVTGGVEIRSEPSGARVSIDGRQRGTTPLTIRELAPGEHTVVLEAGGRKVQQSVRIEAGSTARVTVPMRR
jgi:hypothetical protein